METQNIVFFFQIIFNFLLILNYKKVSSLINIYDRPDKVRKFHKFPVPIVGGILIFINFLLFFSLIFYFSGINAFFFLSSIQDFIILYIFFTIFFLIGLFDDKQNLSPKLRLIFTSLASILIIILDKNFIIFSISLFNFELNFSYKFFSICFTVFCIIVLINALNMIDGINLQFS